MDTITGLIDTTVVRRNNIFYLRGSLADGDALYALMKIQPVHRRPVVVEPAVRPSHPVTARLQPPRSRGKKTTAVPTPPPSEESTPFFGAPAAEQAACESSFSNGGALPGPPRTAAHQSTVQDGASKVDTAYYEIARSEDEGLSDNVLTPEIANPPAQTAGPERSQPPRRPALPRPLGARPERLASMLLAGQPRIAVKEQVEEWVAEQHTLLQDPTSALEDLPCDRNLNDLSGAVEDYQHAAPSGRPNILCEEADQQCLICLEQLSYTDDQDLQSQERERERPGPVACERCKQSFCAECIGAWLEQDLTCPHCRFELLDDEYTINFLHRRRVI
ncbi:hypothetical protein H2203_004556 [Taxawa tesnikishii (nom. ined.)]|nr:hypothetical protein H2203_004556 [Dothideales sp. JES 119]